jgi:osmotically-inducible protein OsmY
MNLLALPNADRETSARSRLPAIDRTAEEQLRRSSYLALHDISCLASDGVITLRGYLPSYYLKQVAQEIVSGVEGVRHVVNRIEVLAPGGGARRGREAPANSKNRVQLSHQLWGGCSSPNTGSKKGVRNDVGPDPQTE